MKNPLRDAEELFGVNAYNGLIILAKLQKDIDKFDKGIYTVETIKGVLDEYGFDFYNSESYDFRAVKKTEDDTVCVTCMGNPQHLSFWYIGKKMNYFGLDINKLIEKLEKEGVIFD